MPAHVCQIAYFYGVSPLLQYRENIFRAKKKARKKERKKERKKFLDQL